MRAGSSGPCPSCKVEVTWLRATDGQIYPYTDAKGGTPHKCFSVEEGIRRKEAALAAVASATPQQLRTYWKEAAVYLAKQMGEISADELREYLMANSQPVPQGPQWGTLFRGAGLEFTGRWVQSRWPPNKGRHIRSWRLP